MCHVFKTIILSKFTVIREPHSKYLSLVITSRNCFSVVYFLQRKLVLFQGATCWCALETISLNQNDNIQVKLPFNPLGRMCIV